MCGSFLLNFFYLGGYPWPCVLSLPERFVGDPASLARDNILFPPASAVEGIQSVPSVRVGLCVSVSQHSHV